MKLKALHEDLDDNLDDADYELPNDDNSLLPDLAVDIDAQQRLVNKPTQAQSYERTYRKGLGNTAKKRGPPPRHLGVSR